MYHHRQGWVRFLRKTFIFERPMQFFKHLCLYMETYTYIHTLGTYKHFKHSTYNYSYVWACMFHFTHDRQRVFKHTRQLHARLEFTVSLYGKWCNVYGCLACMFENQNLPESCNGLKHTYMLNNSCSTNLNFVELNTFEACMFENPDLAWRCAKLESTRLKHTCA